MLTPIKTAPCNFTWLPPKDWDAAKNGPCVNLHAFVAHEEGQTVSWWKISWRDRLRVLFGAPVRLTVIGRGLPPLSLEICRQGFKEVKDGQST